MPYRQQQPSSTRRMKKQQNNKINREMTRDQCNWKTNPGTQKSQSPMNDNNHPPQQENNNSYTKKTEECHDPCVATNQTTKQQHEPPDTTQQHTNHNNTQYNPQSNKSWWLSADKETNEYNDSMLSIKALPTFHTTLMKSPP